MIVVDASEVSANDNEPSVWRGPIDESDRDQMLLVYQAVSDAMCRDQRLLRFDVNLSDTILHAQLALENQFSIGPYLPENVAIITAVVRRLIAADHRERMFEAFKHNIERCIDIKEGHVQKASVDLCEYLQ